MWLSLKLEARLIRARWKTYLLVGFALSWGLAIAATLLSLSDTLIWRPLRVETAQRLVAFESQAGAGAAWSPLQASPNHIRNVQAHREAALEQIAGVQSSGASTVTLTANDASVGVHVATVTPGFFQLFGLQDIWRVPSEGDIEQAVVAHEVWERHLRPAGLLIGDIASVPAFDPSTFGTRPRRLRIAWIAPEGFHFPGNTGLWLPPTREEQHFPLYTVLGLLRPGSSERALVDDALAWEHVNVGAGDVRARPLSEAVVPKQSPVILLLLVATTGLLLSVWCQTTLFTAVEATAGIRALETRISLGASRYRLLVEHMVGPMVLAIGAWASSIAIVAWLQRDIVSVLPFMAGRRGEFGLVSSMLAGGLTLVFILIQAVLLDRLVRMRQRSARANLTDVATPTTSSRLAALSAAVSLCVLYVSMVLAASFYRTLNSDYGFETRGLVAIHTTAMVAGLQDPQEQHRRQAAIESFAASLPGVTSVVRLKGLPFGTYNVTEVVGAEGSAGARIIAAKVRTAGPGLFKALEVPHLAGRDFHPGEPDGAATAIVTRTLAEALWPTESALNSMLRVRDQSYRVVGVVADFSDRASVHAGPTQNPQLFLPTTVGTDMVIKTTGNADAVLASILEQAEAYAAFLRVDGFSYEARRSALARNERAQAWFMGLVSFGALLIAGVAAVVTIAQVLQHGRKRIAVRLALGATHRRALMAVLKTPCLWLGAGSLIGIAIGMALGHAVESSLRNAQAVEPTALAMCLAVALVGLSVGLITPWRRTRALNIAAILKGER